MAAKPAILAVAPMMLLLPPPCARTPAGPPIDRLPVNALRTTVRTLPWL
jgi:hypothetical protein